MRYEANSAINAISLSPEKDMIAIAGREGF
jgi:hypothetical protein